MYGLTDNCDSLAYNFVYIENLFFEFFKHKIHIAVSRKILSKFNNLENTPDVGRACLTTNTRPVNLLPLAA